jgi:hypothetical protein
MDDGTEEQPIDESRALVFNGIDAQTGKYLFEPLSSAELARLAQGKALESKKTDRESLAELKFRAARAQEAHFGVKEGIDPSRLDQAGWGVIFAAVAPGSDEEREQQAISEALGPLRKAQAARVKEHYYKEYRGALGYRPGESKQKYLARLGVGPGPADPEKVPYFLLIVGSPQQIPYHVQYQIDVQYAVGRLHFDTVEAYANYARSVVAAETGGLALAREVAFLGVANPDDAATQLSRRNLIGPLAEIAEGWTDLPGWKVSRHFDAQARKTEVAELFGGRRTPALLFSASHGMGFPAGDPLQLRRQGALLLQDWHGPVESRGPIDEDCYFSGDDVRADAAMLGMIAFNFACYGGGTPEFDEFARQELKDGKDVATRKRIAERAFVGGLPMKLLGHPKGGALATIGHVERAWGYSFMWGAGRRATQAAQLAVFESTLKALMKGLPVGVAMEYFNERYAEMASDLSRQIEELEYDPQAVDAFTLANMWTSSNDARGYAVMGDPAVRLRLGDGEPGKPREALELSRFGGADGARSPAAMAPASAPAAAPAPAGPPHGGEAATEFGLFGGGKPREEGGAPAPGVFQSFVGKIVGTLTKAIEDTMTLEVRTYVSSDATAAAGAARDTLARDGDLRAFTRIMLDGDTDVIVPERDGAVDTALWTLHIELVKQAQAHRAEMLKTVLASISGLIKP